MIFASLLAKLGMDTSAWTSGKDKAVSDLNSLDAKTKGFLKDLKSSFGKSSVMGQLGKLFVGGGAIAGLKMIGSEIYSFADSWVGTSKAADAATDAAKRYNETVKAVEDARKEAKQWELSMNETLIKSYRDLDNAQHPENKARNAMADDIDNVNTKLEKEKQTIKDLQKTIEDATKRRKIAEQDLNPLSAGLKEIKDRNKTYQSDGSNPSYVMQGGNYVSRQLYEKMNGDRMGALEKTIDDEQELIAQSVQKIQTLRGQVAKDEIKANEAKQNIIKTADANAMKEVEKGMEERRKLQEKLADDEIAYRKRQIDAEISGMEEQKAAIHDSIGSMHDTFRYQAQQTDSVRNIGSQIVQATPKIIDYQANLQKEGNATLKSIDTGIKALKQQKATLELVEVAG